MRIASPAVNHCSVAASFTIIASVFGNCSASIFASPAGAKYRDKYVCLWVCLSVCPRGYPPNHTRDLYHFLCILPVSVARSSSSMLTIGRIAYRREGVFFSIENALLAEWPGKGHAIYDCIVISVFRSIL